MTNGELSIEILKQDCFETDSLQNEFLNENIINQSSSDITQILESFTPTENGGRVALSGFYFQFMVAIDYLSQLKEGIWDFMAIEFHDDIIVGNGNNVRFIQVKSSSDERKRITEISELYNRQDRKGNSWVDKILSKASFFKDIDNVRTEFELVTNFSITDGTRPSFSVVNYIDNNNFQMEIEDNDGLLSKLNGNFINYVGNETSYSDFCGEDIRELLGRFHISIKPRGNDYLSIVSNHLSGAIHTLLVVTKSHIDNLIGTLCAMCTLDKDSSILFITKDKATEILTKLEILLNQTGEEWLIKRTNLSLAGQALGLITHEYEKLSKEEIRNFTLQYFSQYIDKLLELSKEKNYAFTQLVSRYIVGRRMFWESINLTEHELVNCLVELIKLMVIVDIIYEKTKLCDKYSTLLVKEAIAEDIQFISFFKVEPQCDYSEAVEKIKAIIKNISVREQLHLVRNGNITILQGEDTDNEFFNDNYKLEIGQDELVKLRALLRKEDSIINVPIKITLVPGINLIGALRKIYQRDSIDDLINKLKDIWFKYSTKEDLG